MVARSCSPPSCAATLTRVSLAQDTGGGDGCAADSSRQVHSPLSAVPRTLGVGIDNRSAITWRRTLFVRSPGCSYHRVPTEGERKTGGRVALGRRSYRDDRRSRLGRLPRPARSADRGWRRPSSEPIAIRARVAPATEYSAPEIEASPLLRPHHRSVVEWLLAADGPIPTG